MPGARWFPTARLNYAAHMLREAGDDDARRGPRPVADPGARRPHRRRAAPPGGPGPGRPGPPRGRAGATGWWPTCPTSPRRWSPSWPPPASARSGRRAPRSSAPAACSTGSARSTRRCCWPSTATATAPRRSTARAEVAAIREGLPGLAATVAVPYLDPPAAPRRSGASPGTSCWRDDGPLDFEPVPFDHPLYVLYSSGTTGLPKPIVHGHGGILLEHAKQLAFSLDLGPGDRFFWFSTTGWMMWNLLVSGAGRRLGRRALRRRPGLARPVDAVAAGRGDGDDVLRGQRPVPPGLPQGRPGAGQDRRPVPGPGHRLDRRAAAAGGVPVGLRGGHHRRAAQLDQRGDRRLLGLRRRLPAAARAGGPDLRPGARRQGRGVRSRRPAGARRAGRARHHRADAVDAGRVLGRRRRLPLPRPPTSTTSPACGATATGSSSTTTAAASSPAGPTRRSTGAASGSAPPSSTRWWRASRRWPTASSSTSRTRPTTASGWANCCCSSCRPKGRTVDDELKARIAGELRRSLSPRHVPDADPRCSRHTPDAVGEEAGSTGETHPHRNADRRRGEPGSFGQPRLARGVRATWRPRGPHPELPLKDSDVVAGRSLVVRRPVTAMNDEPDVLENAVRSLSQLLLAEETLEATHGRVASLACRTLPACDLASVTMINDGRPSTPVQTEPLAADLDSVQYRSRRGPCLEAYQVAQGRPGEALRERRPVAGVQHRGREGRGPARCSPFPSWPTGEPLGALNLYSKSSTGYDEAAEETALLFSQQAAVACANAEVYWRTYTLTEHLREALESRDVIGQAKGILMARRNCTAEAAFESPARPPSTATSSSATSPSRWSTSATSRTEFQRRRASLRADPSSDPNGRRLMAPRTRLNWSPHAATDPTALRHPVADSATRASRHTLAAAKLVFGPAERDAAKHLGTRVRSRVGRGSTEQ